MPNPESKKENLLSEVYIVAAKRTPIGRFQGGLASLASFELGSAAIRSALQSSTLAPEDVEEVMMGQVLPAGAGQAPARQAALGASIPVKVPCVGISKVCGSGLQAVITAAQSIRLGDRQIIVAGGQESMSRSPYLLPGAREGLRLGHREIVDSVVFDGLWDPYSNRHMGNCAEDCARKYNFSREQQDAFAIESYKRAKRAQVEKWFQNEIAPVQTRQGKNVATVSEDEEPGQAQFEKMPGLRPAFESSGSITAANASKINDGAAALILVSETELKKRGLKPLAKIVGWAGHAHEPGWFTTAPIEAIRKVCNKAGLSPHEVDLFEINEAFANVTMAAIHELKLDPERVNIHGGAIALGHPIGASGARILVTLVHALQMPGRSWRRGVASLCIGGGEALAVLVEKCD